MPKSYLTACLFRGLCSCFDPDSCYDYCSSNNSDFVSSCHRHYWHHLHVADSALFVLEAICYDCDSSGFGSDISSAADSDLVSSFVACNCGPRIGLCTLRLCHHGKKVADSYVLRLCMAAMI